jgi:hypothetical protein
VARTIPMPSKEELPDGPRREFVTELRRYYRVARPSLREISQAIERHADPRLDKVTASAETVRRMITGKVLPERERLYAVFRVLCDMAEVDPDAERWEDDGRYSNYPDTETNWQYLRRLWDAALEDESDAPPLPRPTPPPPEPEPAKGNSRAAAASDDPWARDGGVYSGEPPFSLVQAMTGAGGRLPAVGPHPRPHDDLARWSPDSPARPLMDVAA